MAELFHTHREMGGEERARTQKFLRWLGGSIVAHAVLLAALVYVPALRDTFTLANELSGFRVVSQDYEKTQVYEHVLLVNLAAQKLYYPAGYFEAASQTALPSPDDPKFVAAVNPTPEPTPRPPRRVKIKPTPTPEAVPSPQTAEESAQNGADKGEKPAASPSPAEPKSAEEAERIAKESNVEKFPTVNTKPFTDLLEQGRKMKEAGEINLSGTLELLAEADRQDDGRLANVEITGGSASDPKLKKLAEDFIAALSDSKLLAALKGTRRLHMKVNLDDQQIAVRVTTDMESPDLAAKMANGYNGLLWLGAASKKGRDEEAIFKSVKINSEAKQIVLTFQMARKDAGELLSKLAKKTETTTPPSD